MSGTHFVVMNKILGYRFLCEGHFSCKDKYYIYQNRKYVGASNQVLWSIIADGLGSFEGDGVLEKLGKYGESYNSLESFERIFNLPVTVGEELSDLKYLTTHFGQNL